MTNFLPVSGSHIVPNRDRVMPVSKVEKVNLNLAAPRINIYGQNQNHKAQDPLRPNPYGINPAFVIHVLAEAGETGQENNPLLGALAYSNKLDLPKNLMAVA